MLTITPRVCLYSCTCWHNEMEAVNHTCCLIQSQYPDTGTTSQPKRGLYSTRILLLFVVCLTSQQHASVSQGRICSVYFMCCHTEVEVADLTLHLIQSQYTDSGPTSPSTDPITPGAWQDSHWSANFLVTGMTRPRQNPGASGIRTRDLPVSRWTP